MSYVSYTYGHSFPKKKKKKNTITKEISLEKKIKQEKI